MNKEELEQRKQQLEKQADKVLTSIRNYHEDVQLGKLEVDEDVSDMLDKKLTDITNELRDLEKKTELAQ
jgi:hypothetical protein